MKLLSKLTKLKVDEINLKIVENNLTTTRHLSLFAGRGSYSHFCSPAHLIEAKGVSLHLHFHRHLHLHLHYDLLIRLS